MSERLEILTRKINLLREEIEQQEFNVNARLVSREYFPLLQAAEILNKASLKLEDLEIEFLDLMTPSEELPNE